MCPVDCYAPSENVLFISDYNDWGQEDANEISPDTPLPFSLCLIRAKCPFTVNHPAAYCPAPQWEPLKPRKSTSVSLISSGIQERGTGEGNQVDTGEGSLF